MSNRRAILLLILAIVALVAANVLIDRDAGPVRAGGRATLVNPSWEVTGVSIVRKGSPETVLAKTDEWRLTEP